MNLLASALVLLAAIQQRPAPPIDYTLPGRGNVTLPGAPAGIPTNAETMAFADSAVIVRPSPAARHFLLATAPPIPAGGAPFSVRCLVDRSSGRVTHCQDPAVADPYRAAGVALGGLYQFRLTPAQAAGGQRALAVTIAGRVVPADVLPPARRFTFTARAPGNVVFAQTMTGEQSQAYYPSNAMSIGLEGRFRLDCQVQADLSIFCLNPTAMADSDPGPLLPQFQLAALQLSGLLRAAPALSNNAAAPGTIFRTIITFRLPSQ